MKKQKVDTKQAPEHITTESLNQVWEQSWTYIKTVVDIVREPILILDKELRVMVANEPFYRTFQVSPKDTEGRVVYDLGNGQWDVPDLRKLLDDILPKNTFFKGFEVTHDFPTIGRKIMILNAREIHHKEGEEESAPPAGFPPIILLAMEDITEMMAVAETLAKRTTEVESKFVQTTHTLEARIEGLEKEVDKLKNKLLKKKLQNLDD